MTVEELRAELRAILALEEQSPTGWEQVEARCEGLVGRLNKEVEPPYPHDVVYHYLEDADARKKSPRYRDMQRIDGSRSLAVGLVSAVLMLALLGSVLWFVDRLNLRAAAQLRATIKELR